MNSAVVRFAAVLAIATAPALALAQGGHGPSSEMHRMMMGSAKESQSMKMSGDVDGDFLTMMRHHHQSGIKMAEIEARDGKDPKARELARKIIDGQKKEVAEIDKLLEAQGSASGASSRK